MAWYRNSCITGAIGSGLLHVGVDAIGLIPEGTLVSRAIGNSFKYRGIVADQFGNRTIGAVQMASVIGSTGLGANEKSGTGSLSTGLGVAGIAATLAEAAPVVGQVISVASIGVDIVSTGLAIANCH